jgi:hypothetical protein
MHARNFFQLVVDMIVASKIQNRKFCKGEWGAEIVDQSRFPLSALQQEGSSGPGITVSDSDSDRLTEKVPEQRDIVV